MACRRVHASKASKASKAPRRRFDTLPDDILILVFNQCSVPDLLALRLTSPRARHLIADCIATIAPHSARSTFPLAKLLLTRPNAYTLEWLKSRVPHQLAAILIDRHRVVHGDKQLRYGIPAEDVQGEELRARVANGWRVLRRLSNMSMGVYNASSDDRLQTRAYKLVCPSRSRFHLQRQKEDVILQMRLDYIKHLSVEHIQDYKLMWTLLSSAFRASPNNTSSSHKPWVFDWGSGIDGQRLFRQGNSWLAWFTLSEGPEIFWDQWQNANPSHHSTEHYIRDRALAAWEGTNKDMADYHRAHASKVMEAVNERACVETQFERVNPMSYFRSYAEYRWKRAKEGAGEATETMGHVRFFVEFQCPEEILKRHEAAVEQRGAMRASAR